MAKPRRGVKRKTMDKVTVPDVPPKKKSAVRVELDQKNWMPTDAVEFYNRDDFKEIETKLQTIDKKVEFVGPIRKLKGNLDVEGIDLVMLDRNNTDLPEMQVFMKSIIGRYAFWRDTPASVAGIVFMDTLNPIPFVHYIGNKVEHAVFHLCQRFGTFLDNSKEAKIASAELFETLGEVRTSKEMARVVKERKNISALGPIGNGLYTAAFPSGKLRCTGTINKKLTPEGVLRCLNEVVAKFQKSQEKQNNYLQMLDSFIQNVQVYNDEGLYSEGLELGHTMLLANQPIIKDELMKTLTVAYELLGDREDFLKILNVTLEDN